MDDISISRHLNGKGSLQLVIGKVTWVALRCNSWRVNARSQSKKGCCCRLLTASFPMGLLFMYLLSDLLKAA